MTQEGLSDFMRKSDAFLKQFGFDLLHIEGVIVQLHRMTVEAQLILLLINRNELILHNTDCQQRPIDLIILPLDKLNGILLPMLAVRH